MLRDNNERNDGSKVGWLSLSAVGCQASVQILATATKKVCRAQPTIN
jgi:hypothetical protein